MIQLLKSIFLDRCKCCGYSGRVVQDFSEREIKKSEVVPESDIIKREGLIFLLRDDRRIKPDFSIMMGNLYCYWFKIQPPKTITRDNFDNVQNMFNNIKICFNTHCPIKYSKQNNVMLIKKGFDNDATYLPHQTEIDEYSEKNNIEKTIYKVID